MNKPKTIVDLITHQEYQLEKYKFVHSHFPDAKLVSYWEPNPNANRIKFNPQFTSKTVNKQFTDVRFLNEYNILYIAPVVPLVFEYKKDGVEKTEEVLISSIPKKNRLAYLQYDYDRSSNIRIRKICFSRFTFNMKKNNFSDTIFNSCRVAIMDYVKQHPEVSLDTKHLEPRLIKLINFI